VCVCVCVCRSESEGRAQGVCLYGKLYGHARFERVKKRKQGLVLGDLWSRQGNKRLQT
jgi:hypothetical protein